jgi:hypothetical protein
MKKDKKIEKAVKRAMKEYLETFKILAKDDSPKKHK